MKQILSLFAVLILMSATISQVVIGGGTGHASVASNSIKITKSPKANIQYTKLDEATVRCAYRFTQPAIIEKETLQQTDTMTLDIGNKVSKYYDAQRMLRDSIFGNLMKEKMNPSMIQSISVLKDADMSALGVGGAAMESTSKGETALLFKDRKDQQITITDKSDGASLYKCVEKVAAQQWDIASDTLTVLGYLCQKATTEFRGRNYEVWFAPDIPINEGPWKFYGLPGLIMKVADNEALFSFEIIGLEQLTAPVDITIAEEEYINCKIQDLEKLKEKRSGGMGIGINGGSITIVSKKNNTKYMPLEKK